MKKSLVIVALGCCLAVIGCSKDTSTGSNADQANASEDPKALEGKGMIKDIKVGEGLAAENGDLLLVEYTGKLKDGKEFDSNKIETKPERGPLAFTLGKGQLIKGWEEGLVGIKKGGERSLEIPYDKAYGEDGRPPIIPPKADLFFEVKLLDIVKAGKEKDLDMKDLQEGTGAEAKKGNKVKVHYTGTLVNGKKFDSSKDRDEPFEFQLGAGQVIAGWDQGVAGMKVGGKRMLRIPPQLGYGERGAGRDIGPNQVLLFEVELLGVK